MSTYSDYMKRKAKRERNRAIAEAVPVFVGLLILGMFGFIIASGLVR